MSNDGKQSAEDAGQNSLDEFFYRHQAANLNNCDKEPIHLIGEIQAEGALIIIDPESYEILAATENANEVLGIDIPANSSLNLQGVLPSIHEELVDKQQNIADAKHYPLVAIHESNNQSSQVVYHRHKGCGYLEFIPDNGLDATMYREKLRSLRGYCTQIIEATTFERAMFIAAKAAREISEFARVKIYQFQADWSGKVVAEDKQAQMESYMGLYFPETDIPKQARYLMQLVPYRTIANANDNTSTIIPISPAKEDKPYDLSWSLLRASSKMHTEYLRNMGVGSSFSVSLIYKGELWGLIACHNDNQRLLPFDLWGAMQDIATTLMAKLEQERSKEYSKMVHQLRLLEESVANIIRSKGSIEQSVASIMPELRCFLNAEGFAFQYGANLYTEGEVPPDNFILKMIDWATTQTTGTQTFISNSLHKEFTDAEAYMDTACGVLIEPVSLHRVCHLIWFRKPITESTNWAGDPRNKQTRVESDGSETLVPRASFSQWVDEHEDQSAPWTEAEISAAREILKNMLDIVASQIQLTQSNEKLETFSYAAAHDLKTPLRQIRFVLDTLGDLKTAEDIEDMNELINMASKSSVRLQDLIEGMLNYVQVANEDMEKTQVDLNSVIEDVLKLLQHEIDETGVELDIAELPTIEGNKELLTTLFLNLINNSIKYRSQDNKLHVSITSENTPGLIEIHVTDNGQGIDKKYAESVFEPLQRLHHHDHVSGNGLGLAICQRIIHSHAGKISLDTSYTEGAKFILQFKQ